MSDAHLTDHEWRLKMAREGKALYVPGKTVEETAAELAARRAAAREEHSLTLSMTRDGFEQARKAADNAETTWWETAQALHLVAAACDDFASLGQVSATLNLLGEAMLRISETQGAALGKLGTAMGRATREQLGNGDNA